MPYVLPPTFTEWRIKKRYVGDTMRDYKLPVWLKELRRREAAGNALIREEVTLAIMHESGWPRGTVELILHGYNLRSEEIDGAAEKCLGMACKNETPESRDGSLGG